jgi:hypothetical protein
MAAITEVAVTEIVRLREHVMCAMCEELDDRIKRCRLLSETAKDEITIEGLKLLIEKYETDKRALHQDRD